MTNSYDVDHGLSQDAPGPLGLEAPDDTLARTGNTARDQEMYAAGLEKGEENAKHNSAIRGGVPDGWKLVPVEPTDEMEAAAENDYEQRGETFPDWKAKYRAMLAAAPASPVSTVEQGDAQNERSATNGMTLGERIAHVGGRTNAQGYIEFGSPMAVNALIQHVLRDIDWTRQDDDGGYQARYRLPGGQWSSWGHVVCGVKGHEQELRYLPGERRPAPAAGDALDAKRYRWLRDQTETDGIAIVMKDKHFDESRTCAENIDKFIDAALAAQLPQQGEA